MNDTRLSNAMKSLTDQQGRSLRQLAEEKPTLVVLVRHTGCPFCREALDDLREARAEIEAKGIGIALVHLSDDRAAAQLAERYELADLPRLADPDRRLYDALGMRRVGLNDVAGLRVWGRGFRTALVGRHGFGRISGDVQQLAGAAILHRDRALAKQVCDTSYERLDLQPLVQQAEEAAASTDDIEKRNA